MAKIYTKGGDKGQTSLVGGQRVSKTDTRIEAYGTIDELNSLIGVARSSLAGDSRLQSLDQDLETIQHWLFDFGSLLAAEPTDREKFKLPALSMAHVCWLEGRIDVATSQLKPLKNFILPAGVEGATRLHVARTVARRAERLLMMPDVVKTLPDHGIPFINRLSDYFFVMARLTNHLVGAEEVLWRHVEP